MSKIAVEPASDLSRPSSVIVNDTKDKEDSATGNVWTEFRDNTTLHGVQYLKTGQNYRLRWLIWLLVMLGMVALLTYNLWELYLLYTSYPTVTKLQVEYVKEMDYPAITMCNLSPYKRSAMNPSPAMETFLLHHSGYGLLFPPMNLDDPLYLNSDLAQPPTMEWFNRSTFSMDDIFKHCRRGWQLINCSDLLTETITQYGKCFTYNSYNKTKEKGRDTGSMTGSFNSLSFYVDVMQKEYVYDRKLSAGLQVVLHDPDEEPDVLNTGFIVSPGFTSFVSMKMTKFKYLPAPYKAGGDRYCVDTKAPGYVNPLKYYPEYSRSACLLECRRDYIVGKCGCRAITDPGTERYCNYLELGQCYFYTEAYFDITPLLKDQCNCQARCEYVVYDHSISAAVGAEIQKPILEQLGYINNAYNHLEIRLFYDSLSYLYVEATPEYHEIDIIGIFGGQLGLFLGASLLTVMEFLESFLVSVVVLLTKCASVFKKK